MVVSPKDDKWHVWRFCDPPEQGVDLTLAQQQAAVPASVSASG